MKDMKNYLEMIVVYDLIIPINYNSKKQLKTKVVQYSFI